MTYRVYFNRCEDFPQIWSIDEGSVETEVNVVDFRASGCIVTSGRAPDFSALDSNREPKAWLEIQASSVRLVVGFAVFEA